MRSTSVFFDLTDTADDRFDPIIEALLIALLAFMPLALGAVYAWSETVVLAVAGAMGLCLAMKLLLRPDIRFVRSWTYIPIALFVLLAAIQLLPLPAALARSLSPNSVTLKSEILSAVPESMRHLDRITLSFYPEATRANLRMLLGVVAVYVVVINVIRRMEQVRRVLAAVATIGVLVAVLALVQDVFEAPGIYFSIVAYNTTAWFGPFANHSHYGQFMNLSIGAAIGLLLIHFGQLPRSARRSRDEPSLARHFTRPMTRPVWVLGCGITLMAITVPLSETRGGMLSMLIAGVFTMLMMAVLPGMQRRGWALVGLVIVAVLGILLFGFDRVFERVSSIRDPDVLHGRGEILRDLLVAWRAFPVFGTGLGTFEVMFPQFDRSAILTLATHAENEYGQLLMEAGLVGAACIVAFVLMIAAAYVLCVRMSPSPMASAALGLGFGLIAILVHSATDFGQHVPANACLTAVTCALLINLSSAVKLGHSGAPLVRFGGARWPRAVGAVVILAVFGVVVVDGINAWRAESKFFAAAHMENYLSLKKWAGDDVDYSNLILPAMSAVEIRPGDIRYRERLNFYRWKSITRDGGVSPQKTRITRQIVDDLLAGAWHCPTYGPTFLLAGRLEKYVLQEDEAGENHIRLACRLAPTNPDALLEAAILDSHAGNWDDAVAKFDRMAALGPGYRLWAIDATFVDLNRPELAMRLAGDDLDALEHLTQTLPDAEQHRAIAAEVRRRATELVRQRAAEPDAPAKVLITAARLEMSNGNLDDAVALYHRALHAEYEREDWRMELAKLLRSAGRIDDAMQEARIIQRSGGRMSKEAEALIGELALQQSNKASGATTKPASSK